MFPFRAFFALRKSRKTNPSSNFEFSKLPLRDLPVLCGDPQRSQRSLRWNLFTAKLAESAETAPRRARKERRVNLCNFGFRIANFGLMTALSLFFLFFGSAKPSFAEQTSLLWGQQGELWSPESRLPDFSFAGYHMGNDPIPDVPVKANVKNFGAKGDGVTDDTQAFLKAISNTSNGALLIPEGKYVITNRLKINKSNFVLKGEGSGKTILYFPKSLEEVFGRSYNSSGQSNYSFGHAFVESGWGWTGSTLADVTAPALRGDRVLSVSSTTKIKPGQIVRLAMYENGDGSLGRRIHADQYEPKSEEYNYDNGRLVDFASRVEAISGNQVILERPIPIDVQMTWKPEILTLVSPLSEIGIEGITFEFPPTAYAGHHREPGYNAIQFGTILNSWIRDVTVINSDVAINLNGSWFVTVNDVRLAGRRGHHGLRGTNTRDCLFSNFIIEPVFIHDITVQRLAHGNVFSKGSATDITFDHHKSNAYENLFSDINVGRGGRMWNTGGNGAQKTGARNSFWNLRKADGSAAVGSWPGWPQINIIGATKSSMTTDKQWVEGIKPGDLFPQELHSSQLAKRLGGQPLLLSSRVLTATSSLVSSSYMQRVTTGGSSYTDSAGNRWSADQSYSPGSWGYVGGTTYSNGNSIANTGDDPLYQSERYGDFSYQFDVPNGLYDVVLHVAEIYWEDPERRIFDVLIEGASVLNNYDIVAAVGSRVAVTLTFPGVLVRDGQLNIDFVTLKDNAKISAILVSSAPSIVQVNAGGGSYTDTNRQEWSADQSYRQGSWGYVGGQTYTTSKPIDNTDDDPLHQSERYGNFSYLFDVSDGQYDVVLHFAEIYWEDMGKRIFDIQIEGTSVLNNYDIVAAVGSRVAVTLTFPGVQVRDGQLNIDFITLRDNAKVSAISVTSSP